MQTPGKLFSRLARSPTKLQVMSYLGFIVLATTVLPTTAGDLTKSVTSIQKVIDLLQDMVTDGDAKKVAEASQFEKFKSWCDETTKSKKDEIDGGKSKVESLTATIEKTGVKIKTLTSRIEELEEDVGRWESDLKSMAYIRDSEAEDFSATNTDYGESIDAVTAAIKVLEEKALDAPQALLQLQGVRRVLSAKKSTSVFLDELRMDTNAVADDPKAYTSQSKGVLKMLQDLKIKFETKRKELQVQETAAIAAYEKLKDQLETNKKDAESEVKSKTVERSQSEEAKATADGDLAETRRNLEEDSQYLTEMTTHCEEKKEDFEKRTQLRDEELSTIKKAIEIITSDVVKGAGEKHLPKLLQKSMMLPVLAQIRGQVTNPFQQQAIDFLADHARRTGSRLLLQASHSAVANPFTKVKKMIKDLIVKLMEEATTEMEKKGFCDTQLATNKQTREAKTSQAAALQNDVERLTAEIGQLTDDISGLMSEIQELDDALGKATLERTKSKINNENTIKDAVAAQKSVDNAKSILKEFYEKAGKATSLVQEGPEKDSPETFTNSYNGMRAKSGGVLDILEVILSDFQRLESDTAAAESQEAEEYDKLMLTTKKDKAMKEAAMESKSSRKTYAQSDLTTASQDLKATQKELKAAIQSYEKLKPTCVGTGASYEERAKQRKDEIESLQKALEILQKGNGSL